MSLNETTSGERLHIAFFGRRNAGKSSLVNALTGQHLSVVSDVAGTTTDPVKKAMELLPLGPVMIWDTAGFDDEGELGALRVEKTREVLAKTDIAVLVTNAAQSALYPDEAAFLDDLKKRKTPYILVRNKIDQTDCTAVIEDGEVRASAVTGEGIDAIKERLCELAKDKKNDKKIVSDLLTKGDVVILVCPIDAAAPKGRLILPQQQTIRDIIDAGCSAFVCQDTELPGVLDSLKNPPKMVITDSQAFGRVSKMVPADIPLTSFSILFARYKGDLMAQVRGAAALSTIKDGDRVLISEGCTHRRQCGDIGTVKLPAWVTKLTGAKPEFTFTSGGEFPQDLSPYKMIIHCGACMLNETEMASRLARAAEQGVPICNYGVAIAHCNGILRRSLELFPEALAVLG
ncbi:MAG: [Clostridia bacterium]|nr:[FeFe] hydrogenase H-cluster maturation GTPase HydF [Clostridia bacterium]